MPGALDVLRRSGQNLVRAGRVGVPELVLERRAPFWLVLRLEPPLEEGRRSGWPLGREPGVGLLDALFALDRAASDPRVAGVVVRLAGAPQGLAAAITLRRALDRVRAAGKAVAAYGERVGLPELWVASGAERLWLPETGSLHLVGLRSEGLFLSRLLKHFDVRADVVRIGSHKTAGEMLTRDSMSSEQREQTEAYLDDCFEGLVAAIATGRGLEPAAVRDLIDRGPYGARAAVEAGLADGCLYPDEVEDALASWLPDAVVPGAEPARPRLVDAAVYAPMAADAGWLPLLRDLPHVAYVAASGNIRRQAGFGGGIAVDSLGRLIERLADDPRVRALVLRIASPGGDALASDLLWRSVDRARERKPVVVSMGEVAASGGYFAAVAGDAVLAEAATLTGSIGVVGGKLDLSGLYERLGVGRDAVERGARAGILSDARGFTPDERAAVRAEMESIYDVFLRRVEVGRGLTRDAVERVAQGRIWSGRRALELGLVDALGGPLEAIREARARAGIAEGERAIVDVHPRLSPLQGLRSRLGVLGAVAVSGRVEGGIR